MCVNNLQVGANGKIFEQHTSMFITNASVEMGGEMECGMGSLKRLYNFKVSELQVWFKVDMCYSNTHFWM